MDLPALDLALRWIDTSDVTPYLDLLRHARAEQAWRYLNGFSMRITSQTPWVTSVRLQGCQCGIGG